MSNSKLDNILNSSKKTNNSESNLIAKVDSDNIYRAFIVDRDGKSQTMLQLCFKGTVRKLIYYLSIEDIFFYSDSSISLVRNKEVIHISGKNFGAFIDYFQTNKIKILCEYDSELGLALPSDTEPFINSIEIIEIENLDKAKNEHIEKIKNNISNDIA